MTEKAQDKHKMSEIDEGITKIFDIKKRLGKGAYGIVWKAVDRRTNEIIAVKKIFDAFRDETDAQRTFREIVFLKAFRSHPNVVKLHNIYKASNNLDIYLIFEYMESDLHNIIKRGTILKDIHKRFIMYQLINAINYIHSGNVIHRDLKPSNVLIDSKCRCKLADFGLARSVANHSNNSSNSDMFSDKPAELLLTDYVATRWYRAPEILVASKRYTKGIDMWSLGCILAEMIRGKPIFQGSSTVNQIEKIVYTLPDITEHDIRSVGAGFGSVLLNKQILKDKKTTLNELLCGATGDALDLVKSLLVLDPMGRLTAHQALNHSYVKNFRNSIPELELSVDILPPFRDDIRLTVPEYRSKLYEIVQKHGDRKGSLDPFKNATKNRDHKSLHSIEDKSEQKKTAKLKHHTSSTVEDNLQQNSANLGTVGSRAPKKTTSLVTSKSTKSLINTIGDGINNDQKSKTREENQLCRSKSKVHHHSQLCRQAIGDQLCASDINVRRLSTNEPEFPKQKNTEAEFARHKRNIMSKRLHKSSITLSKPENGINNKMDNGFHNTPSATIKNSIRNTKSEVISSYSTPSSEPSKAQGQFCYEKRLNELEEEIKRYKSEVKIFCRGQHKQNQRCSQEETTNSKNLNFKSTPKKPSTATNTPIKNIYFELISKGQHTDYRKSEFDLSGNSGNGSSSDNFRKSLNQNSKTRQCYINTSSQQGHQQKSDHRLTQHCDLQQKQLQSQQRCRPISKFV